MPQELENIQPTEHIEYRSPAQAFAEFMMAALGNPDIPADKLEVLLRARKDVLLEQAREAFNNAYARMATDMPQIEKRGLVELITKDGRELGRYHYARWDDMDVVLRPILSKHGFALSFGSREHGTDRAVLITAELMYGGYAKTAEIPLPPDAGPGRNSLQAVGGALSYGKRYLAELLLNIVRKGADDDATSLTERKIDTEQLAQLAKLLAETKTDKKKFLEMMVSGVTDLAEIRLRDFPRLLNALNQKSRKAKGGSNAQP